MFGKNLQYYRLKRGMTKTSLAKQCGLDRIAMAIAKHRNITLMTGDGNLRKVAFREGISVIGTIGVLDRAFGEKAIDSVRYVELLKLLRDFPRSRQPMDEIELRIARYSKE